MKRLIRQVFFLIIMSSFLHIICCVDELDLKIKGQSGFLTIDASLIKGREEQTIIISRSSSVMNPEFLPVTGCIVKVLDDSENEFLFDEESEGVYVKKIDYELLHYNSQYKLVVSTPSGEKYESAYQTLLETAPVDSFYCIEESHYSGKNDETSRGLQFYVDLNAPDDWSKYYRWQITETWEYRAAVTLWRFWDGETVTKPNKDSLFYCWDTKNVTGIYTANTINLSGNKLNKIPLYFLPGISKKLDVKYCATINQYALNKDAFEYWSQQEKELTESGGIYSNQPARQKSNIFNINNSNEQILGFFWVSSLSFKRLFVTTQFDHAPDKCSTTELNNSPECYGNNEELADYFKYVLGIKPPVCTALFPLGPFFIERYFAYDEDGCVNCTNLGGTVEKPDFWQ